MYVTLFAVGNSRRFYIKQIKHDNLRVTGAFLPQAFGLVHLPSMAAADLFVHMMLRFPERYHDRWEYMERISILLEPVLLRLKAT